MNILPLNRSPNIIVAGVILLITLTSSLLASIVLEPIIGNLEANITSLILNFILTAALILVYTGMARDQEHQTELIEQQVEIASQQRKIMEANHLPLLEIEAGFEFASEEKLSPNEIRVKNRGNGVALHPMIAINPHPADFSIDWTDDDNIAEKWDGLEMSEWKSDWEPIFDRMRNEDGEPIRRIEPGESSVVGTYKVGEHWPCTDSHIFEQVDFEIKRDYECSGIVWQVIVVFDTMLPTSDRIYTLHPIQVTLSKEGNKLFEDRSIPYNKDMIYESSSLRPPGTYKEEEMNHTLEF